MNLRPMLLTNGVLIAGMAAVSLWAWKVIPEGARVPVHWNLEGKADRFGGKAELLLLLPALAVAIVVLLWVLPRLDPRKENMEASAKFWNAAAIFVGLFLAYLHALFVLNATGMPIDILSAQIPALSLLMVGLGNYLGKTRSNWFGGVRTPWTLSSDYSWEKTHRLTGRLFVISGVLGFATWLVYPPPAALVALLAALLLSSLAGVVASYLYWRNDPERTANGTN